MPFQRQFGMLPGLPNQSSAHKTPGSQLVDLHYARLRLVERWDWMRFVRLANFLQLTPWELASLALIRHDLLEAYKRRGMLPMRSPAPTALILTLLEAQALKGWVNDIIPNPFPSLVQMHETASEEKAV